MAKNYRQLQEDMEKQQIRDLVEQANLVEYYPGMDQPVPSMGSNGHYMHPKKLASVGGIHFDSSHKAGSETYFHDADGDEHQGMVQKMNGNEVHLKDYTSGKTHKFTQWKPYDRIHIKHDGKVYQGDNEMSKDDLKRHVELKHKVNMFKDINEEEGK